MKLPIPLILYLTSAGLFGFAGWTVYEMLPLWKEAVRKAATDKGQTEAIDLLTKGKGQGGVQVEWVYNSSTQPWWETLRNANLIGKLPPPPVEAVVEKVVEVVEKPVRPLEEIFELVAVLHDSETAGGNSHVILRYKPEAGVQPPEWYVRENMTPPAGSASGGGPRDVAPQRPSTPRPAGPAPAQNPRAQNGPTAKPTSPMPMSSVGQEVLQKLWVDGGTDPRRSSHLWEPFSEIKLVRVAPDAQSAFFVRVPPPPKEGEAPKEAKEEEMLKTSLNLSQDVVKALRRLQGRTDKTQRTPGPTAVEQAKWVDVQETTLVGKTVNIGRSDEKRFRENSEQFLTQLNLDTYVSKSSNLKGLQVRNVDPQLATRFGVQQGDVLIELNGRSVQTKAQAMQMGKADYERGVRTFQTKWWSNGQVVDRTYQAPDR